MRIFRFWSDFINVFRAISEDIAYYLKLDPSSTSRFHVLFFNASFHGLVCYRFSNFFYRHKLKILAHVIHYFSRVLFSMDLHPAATIEPGVVIDHGIGVVIGSTATVGKGTLIYHGVTLGTKKVCPGKRHPDIGKDVVIGAGAKILGPISVGDRAIIGANAVVLHNVPENSLAVGIPAKILRKEVFNAQFDRQHTNDQVKERTESICET